MLLGNVILADEILPGGQDNQLLINGPNTIFPVLSTPAYISVGALLVISGLDLTKTNKLTLEVKSSSEEKVRVIFNSLLPEAGESSKNPESVSFTANLSLKKVIIDTLGMHELTVKINGDEVTKTFFNIIKNDE